MRAVESIQESQLILLRLAPQSFRRVKVEDPGRAALQLANSETGVIQDLPEGLAVSDMTQQLTTVLLCIELLQGRLVAAHRRADILSVVYPAEQLRGLAEAGVIDELSQNTYTFMGGIYSSRRLKPRKLEVFLEFLKSTLPDEV